MTDINGDRSAIAARVTALKERVADLEALLKIPEIAAEVEAVQYQAAEYVRLLGPPE